VDGLHRLYTCRVARQNLGLPTVVPLAGTEGLVKSDFSCGILINVEEDLPVCIPLNRRYLVHLFQDLSLLPPNILRCRGWIISSVRSLPHPDLPCLVFLLICSTLVDPLLQPRAVNHLSIAFQLC